MPEMPSDSFLTADPTAEPEIVETEDHLLSRCLLDVANELRTDFEELAVLREFASRLESGICNQLPPGMDPDTLQGSPISEVLESLEDIVRVIELARVSPNVVPAPEPCGIPGEATLRARLGVKFASQHCSTIITDKLKNVFEQSSKTHGVAMKIAERCNDIGVTLRGSSLRVLTTLENCASFSCTLMHLAEQRPCVLDISVTASMRKKLEQAALTNCLNRFAGVSKDLAPVVTVVGRQVCLIREFTNSAAQEVEDAFELPFPMSLAQSILIGESPPLRRGLLRRLKQLSEINISGMDESLRQLSKNIDELKVKEAEESLSNFIARAHTRLDKLDALAIAETLRSRSRAVLVPVAQKICTGDIDDVAKAATVPASTYLGEATPDMLPIAQLSKVQDGENECPVTARTLDVEASGLATTNNSVVNEVDSISEATDSAPLYVNLDQELKTVTAQASLDAGGFSPKLIEDQVSASVFQEALANWSPEAGTVTPRSEEPISGSASTSDQQADTPIIWEADTPEGAIGSMEEQYMEVLREASEGCGM